MDIQIERAAETLYQGCCPPVWAVLQEKPAFLIRCAGKPSTQPMTAGLEFQAGALLAYGKETSGENGNLWIKVFEEWEA